MIRAGRGRGTGLALGTPRTNPPEAPPVDLALWIPLTLALGLAALGLMVLFVATCDRV